jgi:8-oxo-dGTP pyrophosphatase MutT (NUDIX family)
MTQPDAAVAIVHARGPEESVLLIRRSERDDDPWSGHWSFPGGRCDPEDRDPLDTALRELAEECGILLTREQMESALPRTPARRLTPPPLLVAPFVFGVNAELPTTLDPREAAAALWLPLRELRDPARHELRPMLSRAPEQLFPCVPLDGTPLWGFTYRLIADWLGLQLPGN